MYLIICYDSVSVSFFHTEGVKGYGNEYLEKEYKEHTFSLNILNFTFSHLPLRDH